jgi:hypothetical protein
LQVGRIIHAKANIVAVAAAAVGWPHRPCRSQPREQPAAWRGHTH